MLIVVILFVIHVQHDTALAQSVAVPQAALLEIQPDGSVMLVVEITAANSEAPMLVLPTGAIAQRDTTDILVNLIERYAVKLETSEVLQFNGVLDATAIPTLTPYARSKPVSGAISQDGSSLRLPVTPVGMSIRMAIRCTGCAADWYRPLLQQLPTYAPVVVIGAGVAHCPGLWRVQANTDVDTGAGRAGEVVTMLSVQNTSLIDRCTITDAKYAAVAAPIRVVTADGTQTLLRVVLCLVVVLLLSISSYYGALALTKRMHSAVGFRPEKR